MEIHVNDEGKNTAIKRLPGELDASNSLRIPSYFAGFLISQRGLDVSPAKYSYDL
jgi:hypothetical protein